MESPDSTTTMYDLSRKASLGKRFLAALIDGIVAAVISVVLGWMSTILGTIAGAAYILIRDGLDLSFMDQRSIGKKVMKLRPVNLDGTPMDLYMSLRRNWPLVLGSIGSLLSLRLGGLLGLVGLVEAIIVIVDDKGRRFGDKFANTQVIEVDD